MPLLTRSGWGPGETSVGMVYAPPLLFQVEEEEPLPSGLDSAAIGQQEGTLTLVMPRWVR